MIKNKGGRPSELSKSITRGREYLLNGFMVQRDAVPSVKGVARYIGKHRSSLYGYARQS